MTADIASAACAECRRTRRRHRRPVITSDKPDDVHRITGQAPNCTKGAHRTAARHRESCRGD